MHGRKRTNHRAGAPVSDPAEEVSPHVHEPDRGPALPLPTFISAQSDGVLLSIKLQPRASKNEIGEPLGDELRIKVTAPPVDAAANEALVRLLAETLDCSRSKVELVRGHTSRHKTVKIYGATPETVLTKLSS
ncbi:MAG: DUF167 domain-containing protein [Verrucomicrobiota bacterium]